MAERRPASRPGDAAREASGERLGSIHIERETLSIDLRPLGEARPAVVEATYRVRNDGGAQSLDLVFVVTALAPRAQGGAWLWRRGEWAQEQGRKPSEAGAVWLDGQPVDFVVAAESAREGMPAEWSPPATTPALEPGADALPYHAGETGPLAYKLTLTPGRHTIRVRYEARPGAYCDARSNAVYWQLGYVLAPARDWASFGGLDAKVFLPEGWRASASLPMRREGDALAASWDKLPADSLAITAQTAESTVEDAGVFWTAMLVLGALLTSAAVFAGWRLGRRLGRRGRTSAWGLLVAPPLAAALVALSAALAQVASRPAAPEQACFNLVSNYNFIVTFFLVVITFTVHFVAAQTATFVARRREAARLR